MVGFCTSVQSDSTERRSSRDSDLNGNTNSVPCLAEALIQSPFLACNITSYRPVIIPAPAKLSNLALDQACLLNVLGLK